MKGGLKIEGCKIEGLLYMYLYITGSLCHPSDSEGIIIIITTHWMHEITCDNTNSPPSAPPPPSPPPLLQENSLQINMQSCIKSAMNNKRTKSIYLTGVAQIDLAMSNSLIQHNLS